MTVVSHYLAADIGGTKSWLAVVSIESNGCWRLEHEKKYLNADFSSIDVLIESYCKAAGFSANAMSGAIFALAGQVHDGYCKLTNLDWEVDVSRLEASFGFRQVDLVNDFYAVARGIELVDSKNRLPISQGIVETGLLKVVTGAGTGLGLAWVSGKKSQPTEGSHSGFAPGDAEQRELLSYLVSEHDFVSWETVLSGAGLERLYRFCAGQEHDSLEAREITAAAEAGDKHSIDAIQLFWRIYASWVGNLALMYRPDGGIYLTGGVTNRLIPWLDKKAFIHEAVSKGIMQSLVEETAVYLVTDEKVGLLGTIALIKEKISEVGEVT